jgi:hypothetical protein
MDAGLGKILFGSNRIKEAFQSFTRFAELSYGEPASNVPSNEPIPPHKSRHDQEQRDYLTSIGICCWSSLPQLRRGQVF